MQEQRRESGIVIPAGVKVDDAPAREYTWRCKQGHLRRGTKPFQLQFVIEGEPIMLTSPLCPVCFRTWLENRFEAKEVKGGQDQRTVGVRDGGHRTG